MNISHRIVVAMVVIVSLVAVGTPRSFASAEDQTPAALAASKNWVAQIDTGNYEDSYSFSCDEMRDKVPEDHWIDVLKALRTPWGSVLNRKQISHIYKPNGIQGLSGECMIITYDTSFQKMRGATEEVVLKWAGGKWRGAGYNAGVKPTGDNLQTPAESTTQTYTDAHVKAKPNTP